MRWRRPFRRAYVSSGVVMLNKLQAIARGLLVALLVLASARAVLAEERRLPVPAVTIHPGEVIREEMVAERAFAANLLGVAMFVDGRSSLVGRMARRTLLPGQPIPINAVEDPAMTGQDRPGILYACPALQGGLGEIAHLRGHINHRRQPHPIPPGPIREREGSRIPLRKESRQSQQYSRNRHRTEH